MSDPLMSDPRHVEERRLRNLLRLRLAQHRQCGCSLDRVVDDYLIPAVLVEVRSLSAEVDRLREENEQLRIKTVPRTYEAFADE